MRPAKRYDVSPDVADFDDDALGRFRDDGFVAVPDLFRGDRLRQLIAWVDELESESEKRGEAWFYYEDSLRGSKAEVLARIEYFDAFHVGLRSVMRGPDLLGRAAALLGEPAVLFKEKINFKMPGGRGFEPHQDAQAGWEDHGGLHLTAMVSIDPATVENGCLELAVGHNRRGPIGNLWKPLQSSQIDGVEFTHYPTEPGDALFFDSYAPHRSAPNDTDARRRVLLVTYGRAREGDHRESYFAAKFNSFPPDIEREAGKEYAYKV